MHPLDNPIWQALTTTHAGFSKTCKSARKFTPEVSVLAGFPEPTLENYESLAFVLDPGEPVGLFLQNPPDLPAPWTILSAGPLLQMVGENPPSGEKERFLDEVRSGQPEFVRLTQADVPEMLALTELTKPGPFGSRTHEMGDYFGICRTGTGGAGGRAASDAGLYRDQRRVYATRASGKGLRKRPDRDAGETYLHSRRSAVPSCPFDERARHPSLRALGIQETRVFSLRILHQQSGARTLDSTNKRAAIARGRL
jgi:hypothetical protein